MDVSIKWNDRLEFIGTNSTGREVLMDGQKKAGPSPMEMLLIGTGGCSSVDMVLILDKMRQHVTDVDCNVTAERAEEDPKVFTRIDMHFIVTGEDLDPKRVERAVALSAEKYCSASIMLGKTAEITHSFEIIDA